MAKKLHHFHPLSIAFWRFQGAFLPVLPIIMHKVLIQDQADKLMTGLWPLSRLKNCGLFSLVLVRERN